MKLANNHVEFPVQQIPTGDKGGLRFANFPSSAQLPASLYIRNDSATPVTANRIYVRFGCLSDSTPIGPNNYTLFLDAGDEILQDNPPFGIVLVAIDSAAIDDKINNRLVGWYSYRTEQ